MVKRSTRQKAVLYDLNKTLHKLKRSPHLASKVKWEPEEEDVRKSLDYAEESIDNPVGQPLRVILLGAALDCLDSKQTREVV